MNKEQKNELDSDPNYIAYQALLNSEEGAKLDPDLWLAFQGGKLIAEAPTRENLFTQIDNNKNGPTFYTKVKPEVIRLNGFFIDAEDKLRRGVAIRGIDASGNEIKVGLEWGTMKTYELKEQSEENEE